MRNRDAGDGGPAFLTPGQRDLQSTFREYARERIAPRAAEFDRKESMPREHLEGLAAAGFLATQVPTGYGGRGIDAVGYGLLHEEIGRACSSTRTLLTVHDMVAEVIHRIGSEEQRQRWLPHLTSGQLLAAFALTEPAVGSDAAAIETTAWPSGNAYRLTGHKRWISFGQLADRFLVIARLGEGGPPTGFLLARNTPGLTIKPMRGLLGLRGSMLAELHLDSCPIGEDARIGPAGLPSGLLVATALHLGRYGVAWGCLGIAESCREVSFQYSAERTQFGLPLGRHQLIQRMLTNMLADVRAARLLCLEAGHLRQARDPAAVQATLIAKYFAARMANRVAGDAVQIHGANGIIGDRPIERHFRDAKIMEIIEGSREIHQMTIARHGATE